MKALISPNEIVTDYLGNEGQRVAQVAQETFEIAEPLFWTDCPDECVADAWWYVDGVCSPLPEAPVVIGLESEY